MTVSADPGAEDPSSDAGATPPRTRTGGRSARVRAAILAATVDQVAEFGAEGLRFSDVAARARVAETTVYRRWSNRTALLADAVTELADSANPPPDTGALGSDLQVLAEQIIALLSRRGIVPLLGVTLSLTGDPSIEAARRRFWQHRFEQCSPLVQRAVERGELAESTDPRSVLETLAAPLYLRAIVGDRPFDADFAARCVADTVRVHGR